MATRASITYDKLCEITDDLEKDLQKVANIDDPSTRLVFLNLHGHITKLAFALRHLTIDLMDDEDAAAQAARISST